MSIGNIRQPCNFYRDRLPTVQARFTYRLRLHPSLCERAAVSYVITELLGDGISAELAESVRILIDALPVDIKLESVDLSLANRKRRGREIFDEAENSIRKNRYALKYPTTTDGESPNAILRQRCRFSVIHRPVTTLPAVPNNFRRELDLNIIRVARGGTYDDPGRAIGSEVAVSLRIVERQVCWEAANYAFALARRLGCHVTSGSKHTIQAATDGLFETVVDEVSQQFDDVTRQEELFDALLAKVIMFPERFNVVLVLNEYGDFLSDMACGLAGSTNSGEVELAMFDPAGGTAPDIAGQDIVNPAAIFLAMEMLMAELGEPRVAAAIRAAVVENLQQGHTTRDLGGSLSTTQFSHRVADSLAEHLGLVTT